MNIAETLKISNPKATFTIRICCFLEFQHTRNSACGNCNSTWSEQFYVIYRLRFTSLTLYQKYENVCPYPSRFDNRDVPILTAIYAFQYSVVSRYSKLKRCNSILVQIRYFRNIFVYLVFYTFTSNEAIMLTGICGIIYTN